jgi:hypothetical protein
VFKEVVKHWDCTILEGHRNQERQDLLYNTGKSQVRWPLGKHNRVPSLAVDVAPWPVDWENRERFIYFAGFVIGIASSLGIQLRHGGDWNQNKDTSDESFSDLVHFEVMGG